MLFHFLAAVHNFLVEERRVIGSRSMRTQLQIQRLGILIIVERLNVFAGSIGSIRKFERLLILRQWQRTILKTKKDIS